MPHLFILFWLTTNFPLHIIPVFCCIIASAGKISTWDTRIGQIVESLTLQGGPPIAHLAASPPDIGVVNPEWRNKQGVTAACDHDDKCDQDHAVFEGYLLAANCYDGTLRVRHHWPFIRLHLTSLCPLQ